MKNKDEIIKILGQEMPFLRDQYHVEQIGLFGSYAHGETTPKSDIDLLVQFERPVGFFKFIELENYLSEKLGIKVDLVTEDALKPLIKTHVMESLIYV
jgi:predicted nucleotidyltransferase